jgi:hypothetical protein
MTQAQMLVQQFRTITAPGSTVNTWKWATRATRDLTPLGNSTIGSAHGNCGIAVFQCEDRSRFGYDLNGAQQVWAMPA